MKRRADLQDKVMFSFCISFAVVILFYSFSVSTVLFVCPFPVELCRERAWRLGYTSSITPSPALTDIELAKRRFSFFKAAFYFGGVGGILNPSNLRVQTVAFHTIGP
jgi:hypothetical protein